MLFRSSKSCSYRRAGKFLARRYEQLLEALKKLIGVWLVFGQRQVSGERRALMARLGHLPQALLLRRQRTSSELLRLAGRCDTHRMLEKIGEKEGHIGNMARMSLRNGSRILRLAGERLDRQGDVIGAHSPERVLKRGFTLLLDREGRVISRRETFLRKQSGRLCFQDGETVVKPGDEGDEKQKTL